MKSFHKFRLDTLNHYLWRDNDRVPIAPKTFDVLRFLVENAGKLVTQEDLLKAVWPDTYVNPEILRKYILEIRKVLGDRHDDPIFIETHAKRGYRFVAPIEESESSASLSGPAADSRFVGREDAIAVLERCLETAARGHRQVIFVTGEAGIGKTALVDEFHRRASVTPNLRFARGQCVEGFGGKEAYYPVLDALGKLMRGPDGARVVRTITERSPTWLVQFPEFIRREQHRYLQQEILGSTSERMLREICDALETLAERDLIVLVLEDIHWVDTSTLDLISAVARGRGKGKLILLCTARMSEVGVPNGLKILKQELLVHGLCSEIALESLGESDVATYLNRELDGGIVPPEFPHLVYRNSGGNALFMTVLIRELVDKGMFVLGNGSWTLTKPLKELAHIIPATLQQALELQFEQLDDTERDILKSASVAGDHFSVWVIAPTLEIETDRIEDICEALAERRQFLRPIGIREVKSGGFSPYYEFRHALYRDVLYRRLSDVTRSRLHRLLARRLESLFTPTNHEIASEIAMHFEEGFDFENTIKFLIVAAENAARRFAYKDSVQILQDALERVDRVSANKRLELELRILELIGDTHYWIGAMSDSADAYQRQVECAANAGDKEAQVRALSCLAMPLGFLDPDRGLEVTMQAVQLSVGLTDSLPLSLSKLMSAGYSLVYDAWRKDDWETWRSMFENICNFNDNPLPLYHRSLHSYLLLLQGGYRRVLTDLEANSPKTDETYSLIEYFFSLSTKTIGLLFSGQFGDLLRVLREGQERARKNGNDPWLLNFREAWLRILIFDYEGAYRLCADVTGGSVLYPTGQPETLARLARGYKYVQKTQFERAIRTFEEIIDPGITPKFFLHWFWRMQAHLAIGNAWLTSGNFTKARVAADRFLKEARSTAEPNLNALAWELQARVAIAEDNLPGARKATKQALKVVENSDLPVTAWTVHATAWEINLLDRNAKAAEAHRVRAAEQILAQADSFEPDEPLRKSFLSAPSVSRILGRL